MFCPWQLVSKRRCPIIVSEIQKYFLMLSQTQTQKQLKIFFSTCYNMIKFCSRKGIAKCRWLNDKWYRNVFSDADLAGSSVTANAHSELDVSRHDRDTLGVNGAKICVLEQSNAVSLRGFLQGRESSRLIAEVVLEVHRNFFDLRTTETVNRNLQWAIIKASYQALKRSDLDKQLGGLLITTDLLQGDRSWTITTNFLLNHRPRAALERNIASDQWQMFSRWPCLCCLRFGLEDAMDASTGGFASSLLGSHHCSLEMI